MERMQGFYGKDRKVIDPVEFYRTKLEAERETTAALRAENDLLHAVVRDIWFIAIISTLIGFGAALVLVSFTS